MDLNELNSILQKGWPEGDDLKSFKFTVSNVYIKSLNKPDLTPSLKQEFKNNDTKEIGLSENAHAIVKVNDVRWVIKDNENVYDISKDEEELKIFLYNIPFGEEIEELGDRNAKHVKSVLSHMNSLIEKPFCDGFKDIWDKLLDKNGILNQKLPEEHPWKGKIDILLRIAALYHDIGKVIISERHSLEGFYYFAHVKPSQRGKLEKILGEGDILLGAERFKILSNMLKYHDLWGVLSTGEGSVIVLLDVLPYHIAHPIDQITTLSLLLLINMADIMEAIEPERYDSKAKLLSEEWEKLCKEVEESKGDRQELTNNLIRKDQREAIAIERIRRLLCERVPQNAPDVFKRNLSSSSEIEEALMESLGTRFHDFVMDFPLICKFDYALGFVIRLEKYAVEKGKDSRAVVDIVVSLISNLVQCYCALTRRGDDTRRRIGVQLNGLTRTEEISNSLIELLFNVPNKGLEWSSKEVTAFYID